VRLGFLLFSAYLMCGCAFSQRWEGHYPNANVGWTNADEFGFSRLNCSGEKITAFPLYRQSFTFFGPALLPVIPFYWPFQRPDLVLSIEARGQKECPLIRSGDRVYTAEPGNWRQCSYHVGRITESEHFEVSSEIYECGNNDFSYQREIEWRTDLLWADFD